MATHQDKLLYFDVRARAEPTRMVYALAGKPLTDERVSREDWPKTKEETPLGQVPLLNVEEGTIVMSNTIARYAAKKNGLSGSNLWEETLNDMIVETCLDCFEDVPKKIYMWKIFKMEPEPENVEKVMEEVKGKFVKGVNYIQSVAEKRGKKFIICDQPLLADAWLYSSLEFCKLAYPDVMEVTPWVKEFVSKMESCEKFKKYLAERPESSMGL